MNWTEQQLEAITTEGSDILVSAAAGSGKTAVLTERIRRLVTEKQIPLEKMLVVTFTNAAASEMKEKILDALRKEESLLGEQLDQESERGKKKKFVRKQIRNAAAAEICTFHRFAMDVIRRFFFLTDIDPHFSICEESYGSLLREKCLNDMFEEKYESADPDFLAFMSAYTELNGETKARNMILQVYDFIMNMSDPFDWLHHHIEELNCTAEELRESAAYHKLVANTQRELNRALKVSDRLLQQAAQIPELDDRANVKKTLFQKMEANGEMVRELAVHCGQLSLEELQERMKNINWVRLVASKPEKEAYALVKEEFSKQINEYKGIIKDLVKRLPSIPLEESAERVRSTCQSAEILEKLVKEFAERFTAAKREKNLLDFNDVEHEAFHILSSREHPEAAEEYRNRFDVIFIDEYQDSSRIQEAMIQCVSRGNNVYMVGDVKQSIYKFRQADPDIFIRKYNGFEEGDLPGIRIDLSRNFRSKGGVIDAVNGVFRHIMTRELSGIAYDKAAELVQGSGYERGGALDYGVSLHVIDPKAGGEEEQNAPEDLIDEEIAQLSNAEIEGELIARLVEERLGRPIFDDKKGIERSAGYGDIVILLRSRTNMEIYARSLMNRGIPAYTSGGEGFYEAPEVRVMMDLLRVLNNHRRDKELISVLYSSIEGFGFTVNDLAMIRILSREAHEDSDSSDNSEPLQRGRETFSDAFFALAGADPSTVPEEAADLVRHCAAAAAQLGDWRKEVRCMPLDDFIWKIMMETGYYGYVSALPGGARRSANLRLLADRAGEYVRSLGGGLFSFLRFEEQIEGKGVRISQAVNPGDTTRMVQIMTIHNSKGLEFPIVFVPNISSMIQHDRDTADLQMHKDLGISLKYRSREEQIEYKTLPYEAIVQVKREEDFEEEKRILYVAMTRAKDELILTAVEKGIAQQLEKEPEDSEGVVQSPDRRLSWILDNAEEAGIPVSVYGKGDLAGEVREEDAQTVRFMEELEKGFPDFVDQEGLIERIQKRMEYSYPYQRDSAAKSKYSVTELNRTMNGKGFGPVQHVQVTSFQQEEAEADPAEEKYLEEALYDPSLEIQREVYDPSLEIQRETYDPSLEIQREVYDPSMEIQRETYDPSLEIQREVYDPSLEIHREVYDPSMEIQRETYDVPADIQRETYDLPPELQRETYEPPIELQKDQFDSSVKPERDSSSESDVIQENSPNTGKKAEDDSIRGLMPAFLSGEAEITPAMRGTLTHRVLELIDYTTENDEDRVREFCHSLVRKGILSEAEMSVIPCDRIAGFFASDLGKRACQAKKRRNEWAFTLQKKTAGLAADAVNEETARSLKENLPEEILVQGIIDCCFRDEKGIVIVDFKTDHVHPYDRKNDFQNIRDRYRRQLAFYREAVEKEYGEPVSEMYLYLLDASCAVSV